MKPSRTWLLAILFLLTVSPAHAGKIRLTPWDDQGPFVDYPMIAAGFAVGVPIGVVGGALSAPFIAAGVAGNPHGTLWQETKQRGIEIGALTGIFAAVAVGAPFYGVKALVWDGPASAIARLGREEQERRPADPPRPTPVPTGPAPMIDDRVDVGSV